MPTDSQSQSWTPAAGDVVRAAIHPAIGVARVGNSWTEYFIGPEVIAPRPEPPGSYRDASGALKRQAARFRIYGYNAAGEVVGELSPGDETSIKWTVHVANRKAAWYQWQMAMDIPEAATIQLPRRNAKVTGDARKALVIDAGPRTIEGKETQGAPYQFRGKFASSMPRPVTADVYLGEVRTDADGRLLFLGGHGVSASPVGSPIFIDGDDTSFINADGWYDDMSDGPVTAEVTIGGPPIPVEPGLGGDGAAGLRPRRGGRAHAVRPAVRPVHPGAVAPAPRRRVSFRDDVYPILQRLSGLQWVNQGFATQFGRGGPQPLRGSGLRRQARARAGPRRLGSLRRAAAAGAQLVPQPGRHRQQSAALAVGLRRRHERPAGGHPAAERDGLAHAVPDPPGVGRGPVRGRLGRRRGGAARDRSGRAEGPAGDARSGGAGILPGRRVPPRAAR